MGVSSGLGRVKGEELGVVVGSRYIVHRYKVLKKVKNIFNKRKLVLKQKGVSGLLRICTPLALGDSEVLGPQRRLKIIVLI